MFVERKSIYELPEDAVIIPEYEALQFYRNLVGNRKNKKEAWPFSYGTVAQSLSCAISTGILGFFYRRRLRSPDSGKIFFFMLTGGLAGALNFSFSYVVVQSDVLMQKECKWCVYLKALFIQLGSTLLFGLGGSALISFHIASTLGSIPLPITQTKEERNAMLSIYRKLTRKQLPNILGVSLFNAVLTIIVVFKQYQSFDVISLKAMKSEKKLLEIRADNEIQKLKS